MIRVPVPSARAKLIAGVIMAVAGLAGMLLFVPPPSFGQVFWTALFAVGSVDLIDALVLRLARRNAGGAS